MGTRLKRRSSIGQLGRRDSITGTPETHTPEMFDQDDDAERRVRNRRRQAQNLETVMSQESPGVERAGSDRSRRSIGGLSGLSAAQLAEHYNNCIKLCAENKISTKNAFNLQLIDYMATMIKKKESDMNNFQVAAGTLDASTKIYAYRVDSVYGDTLKIAGGLGQAGKPDPGETSVQEGDGEGEMGNAEPKKKRRQKKSATVEKNLKNINVNRFELEFDVDPLFKKTSSQFDSGSGGNQFLASLQVRDDSCELMLDSDKMLERVNIGNTPVKEPPHGAFSSMKRLDLEHSRLDHASICPTFEEFSFKWSLEKEGNDEDEFSSRLNESISASQEERNNFSRIETGENAFDALAVPDGDDYCDMDPGDMDDMERTEWSERAVGHAAGPGLRGPGPGLTASLPMTTADMLSALTTAPLEYSYFDTGKLGAWAGPKHWKFKPISKTVTETDKTKGRKKKETSQLVFSSYNGNIEDQETEEMMSKLVNFLSVPKKSVKLVEKTMKGWNREKNTLPEDLHYSGHELVRLKTVDRMVVQNIHNNNHSAGTTVDDVEAYNYENAADQDGYCPDFADNGAYADAETADNFSQDSLATTRLDSADQEVPDISMSSELFAGENLVAAPKLVDKAALQIGYAKTAKKVDMKRIKSVAWNILTQASNEVLEISRTRTSVRQSELENLSVNCSHLTTCRRKRTVAAPRRSRWTRRRGRREGPSSPVSTRP